MVQTQRDFEELRPEEAAGLRDSLVTLLIQYGPGPRTVRMQICIAIAAMAVHVPSEQFGNGGVIGWLFSKLQQESEQNVAVICMLEFLATLPQVCYRN
jgi:transportin-3